LAFSYLKSAILRSGIIIIILLSAVEPQSRRCSINISAALTAFILPSKLILEHRFEQKEAPHILNVGRKEDNVYNALVGLYSVYIRCFALWR
jgi:hypothetical protein